MRYLAALLTLFMLSACQQQAEENLLFSLPDRETLQKANSSFAVLPTNKKLCFAVNVKGPGINTQQSSCLPPQGLLSGFVEGGKSISLDVPKGSGRVIELYLLLADLSASCPKIQTQFDKNWIPQLYRVGLAENVDLTLDKYTIEMEYVFPGLLQHIGRQSSLPASCFQAADNPPASGMTSFSGVATGSGIVLRARAGTAVKAQEAQGNGIILRGQMNF